MTRKNAQPQFGRPRFCTPAWAAAFRGSGSAWRLVMARMRPDSFHRLPRGRNAQGRTVAKAVAVASARERALDAEATSTGTAGRILRPSDSPADSSGGMSSGQTRLLRCRCAGVSQRQTKTLHLHEHRPVACARSAKRPGRLEAFVRRDLHEFPCNGYFGLLDDLS